MPLGRATAESTETAEGLLADELPATAAAKEPSAACAETARLKLSALEARVAQLRARVFESKARLRLLREALLDKALVGSRVAIWHKNDMGGAFTLVGLTYLLDGAKIYAKADQSGKLDNDREFEVFSDRLTPGEHLLAVHLVYRGKSFGLFSYVKGYEFNVRASHPFMVSEGEDITLRVRAYEQGNFTTELEDRPAVSFEAIVHPAGGPTEGGLGFDGGASADATSGQRP